MTMSTTFGIPGKCPKRTTKINFNRDKKTRSNERVFLYNRTNPKEKSTAKNKHNSKKPVSVSIKLSFTGNPGKAAQINNRSTVSYISGMRICHIIKFIGFVIDFISVGIFRCIWNMTVSTFGIIFESFFLNQFSGNSDKIFWVHTHHRKHYIKQTC